MGRDAYYNIRVNRHFSGEPRFSKLKGIGFWPTHSTTKYCTENCIFLGGEANAPSPSSATGSNNSQTNCIQNLCVVMHNVSPLLWAHNMTENILYGNTVKYSKLDPHDWLSVILILNCSSGVCDLYLWLLLLKSITNTFYCKLFSHES